MKFYFSLICIALAIAAICGGALLWDGSYFLYHVLDTQNGPALSDYRPIVIPLQWPAALAARLTNNIDVVRIVFGMAYAAIPGLALGLSWWMVRKQSPSLFVWTALGIGFGTLTLQLDSMVESVIALQLFWPIELAMLMNAPSRAQQLIVAVLSVVLVFTHPFSIPLLALAAGLAIIAGVRNRGQHRQKWLWAAWLAGMAVVATWRFAVAHTSYETERLSLDLLRSSFAVSLAGLPILALGCIYAAAFSLFALPRLNHRWPAGPVRAGYGVELGGIVAATLLFLRWASVPSLWGRSFDFRTWSLFVALPFMGLAALESFLRSPQTGAEAVDGWRHRRRIIQLIGVAFTLVLTVQSLSWVDLTHKLQAFIAQSSSTCIGVEPLNQSLGGYTALEHWSVTPYSLILQGRRPQKIVMAQSQCEATDFSKGLPIADWEWRDWKSGWFDLRGLNGRLIVERLGLTAMVGASTAVPYPTHFTLGKSFVLAGYGSPTTRMVAGETLPLDLFWQAGQTVEADYTVFLHLTDANGNLVATWDAQPLDGKYPTSVWNQGEMVQDTHALLFPATLAAGKYTLYTGMYLLETMERLPVKDAHEKPVPDNAIRLMKIEVTARP